MDKEFFYVAGHRIVVTGTDVVPLLHRLPGYSQFREPTAVPSSAAAGSLYHREPYDEWEVVCQKQRIPCAGELLYSYYFSDLEVDSYFRRSADEVYYYEMTSRRASGSSLCLRYRPKESIVYASQQRADASMLHYALWFSFALMSVPMVLVPVHGSAVVWHDQAVMFLGESGTGKSTHSRLWLQNVDTSWLLNDDSPVVSLRDGNLVVYGSPWSGKTPCFHNQGYPLRAIVRLSQAPQNEIERLSLMQAVAAVQPSCPTALAYDARYADAIQYFVGNIVSAVPTFHLCCMPDAAAARLCFETLREACLSK